MNPKKKLQVPDDVQRTLFEFSKELVKESAGYGDMLSRISKSQLNILHKCYLSFLLGVGIEENIESNINTIITKK